MLYRVGKGSRVWTVVGSGLSQVPGVGVVLEEVGLSRDKEWIFEVEEERSC